jgi:biopolymer transport protein ExbD
MDVTSIVKQPVEMDMTPMIDCVFLLMIFFVLVIDLSQKNLEDLVLPRALHQDPDVEPPKNRPIVNVLQNGAVVYNQRVYYDPAIDGRDYGRIRDLLREIKRVGLAADTLHERAETIGGRTVMVMDDPILLRADKWTEWHYVGEVMRQCSQPDIAFWKVELAMATTDKETGETNPPKGAK